MEILLTKTLNGLVPIDEGGVEALKRYKLGAAIKCKLIQARNPKFHAKYFALLNLGFTYWQPGVLQPGKYGVPKKNFDRFREQVIILAGYYNPYIDLYGRERVMAKSISFANMEEHEFAQLYSASLDVLLERVFDNYTDYELMRMVEQQLLEFS